MRQPNTYRLPCVIRPNWSHPLYDPDCSSLPAGVKLRIKLNPNWVNWQKHQSLPKKYVCFVVGGSPEANGYGDTMQHAYDECLHRVTFGPTHWWSGSRRRSGIMIMGGQWV